MSKCIATLTFHRAMNYGAVLQAVALQKSINRIGYDCEILDYDNREISSCYDLIKPRGIRSFIKSFLSISSTYKKNTGFNNFLQKYSKLSRQVKKSDLVNASKNYYKTVTGSDQVWNYELTGNDSTYFLDFVDIQEKKVSYAASFGISVIPDEWQEEYKRNISSIGYISTREKTGADIVESLCHREVQVVLDPVFLPDISFWQSMVKADNKKYIFMYMPTPECIEYAKKLSQYTGMEIYHIAYSKSILHPEKNIGKCILSASPDEFISLLYNAEYVVTGSFHATSFSIIFNKTFFVNTLKVRGSRITDLLEMTGLKNRMFKFDGDEVQGEIDWKSVNEIIDKKREESIKWLKESLE